jgi:bacillithiol biosynthesis cysteine-adding enzyme BshC
MTLPRIITEELGGSALAFAAQRDELPQWYLPRPRGADAWRAYLHHVADSHESGEWLGRLAPAIAATGAARSRLDRVTKNRGIVVSSGQQAALFGGPLYTLIKAIGALGVADALEQSTGIASAVVFWAATDDADYEEAKSANVATVGGLRTLTLPPPERAGITMNDMPMPGVEELVEELAQACGSVSAPETLEIIREVYGSRATLGSAYVRQLRALLEPLGVAVLDASHTAVRRAGEPVLTGALHSADEIDRALRARSAEIEQAGFSAQVEHVAQLSLVFSTDDHGEKRRLPISEAVTAVKDHPVDRLSANVLLRPLVERFIMPSAAYVAGPGELAYFAQVSAVADVLSLPRPLPLPRWSATVVEPRIERLLSRLGITREELLDRHAVERRLARNKLPDEVATALQDLRQTIESRVATLNIADGDNLVPPASLEGLRGSLLHRLERVERRYLAAVKRRESDMMRDLATAAASLRPNGMRQERILNFVPFLARYGRPLLDLLREEATRDAMSSLGARNAGANLQMPQGV